MRTAVKVRLRLAFEAQRAFRASWGPAVVAAMVYLLARGWFPDLRQPGADWGRAAAAALLAAVLAPKIAARPAPTGRRGGPAPRGAPGNPPRPPPAPGGSRVRA